MNKRNIAYVIMLGFFISSFEPCYSMSYMRDSYHAVSIRMHNFVTKCREVGILATFYALIGVYDFKRITGLDENRLDEYSHEELKAALNRIEIMANPSKYADTDDNIPSEKLSQKLKEFYTKISLKLINAANNAAENTKEFVEKAKNRTKDFAQDTKGRAHNVADRVEDKANQAKENTKNFVENAKERTKDFAAHAKDRVQDFAENTKDVASDLATRTKEKAQKLSSAAKEKAIDIKEKVQDKTAELKERTHRAATDTKEQADDDIETAQTKKTYATSRAKGKV